MRSSDPTVPITSSARPDSACADPGAPGPGRRCVLVGVAAGASAVLAGCAAYGDQQSSSSAAPAPAASGSGAGASGGGAAVLAALTDVPVGGGTVLAAQKLVLTQPTAGTVKAFSAICTHQGCTVSEVSGGTINCPCHGSRFRIADGSGAGGPAPAPLPSVAVTVANGKVVRG